MTTTGRAWARLELARAQAELADQAALSRYPEPDGTCTCTDVTVFGHNAWYCPTPHHPECGCYPCRTGRTLPMPPVEPVA